MLTALRVGPAITLLATGVIAYELYRKAMDRRAEREQSSHDVNTWEAEGGNLPPGSSGANTPEPETSLATAAP